jgi:galactokinase
MRSVAALMGKKTLRECDESDFMKRIPYLRSIVGDRTVMRAMHYFAENRRVNLQKEALQSGDIDEFLKHVTESGDSSFKYLQNVYSRNDVQAQGISLAIALSERMGVVCRVHGGGFAGTVQAYVKNEILDEYISSIESVFGEKSCHICKIRPYGVALIEEDGIKS